MNRTSTAQGSPRIAILWKQMTGYTRAAFSALVGSGAEVLLVHRRATAESPFDDAVVSLPDALTWTERPDVDEISSRLAAFQPDAVFICGWDVGGYRRVASSLGNSTLRVLCMDNPWLATAKQRVGVLGSPWLIQRLFDAVLLPADRQADFARRLGFSDDEMIWGMYTCDYATFAAALPRRLPNPPRAFLFVGQLIERKGVDILVPAYERYRAEDPDPWPLIVAGTGPWEDQLRATAGVEVLDFVQPSELPSVFTRASCLVLPSRFEPWGVVVHEATAAGLGVICSSAVGASSRLVLDGYNGSVVSSGSAAGLSVALKRMSALSNDELVELSARSQSLARQFTPARWATEVVRRVEELACDRPVGSGQGIVRGR